jgi:hypothetical protein
MWALVVGGNHRAAALSVSLTPMPFFKKRQPAAGSDQEIAEAAYEASSDYLGRVNCSIDGGGGEYFQPVSLSSLSRLRRFISRFGDASAEYGERPAWDGYAYLVPRPNGGVEVVANGAVIDDVVGDCVEVVQALGVPLPVRCTVQRFNWQSGEWFTVKVTHKTRKQISAMKQGSTD